MGSSAGSDIQMMAVKRRMTWSVLRQWPLGSLTILVVIVVMAISASWAAPYDPVAPALSDALEPPVGAGGTWQHVLGTDSLGRDILTRLMFGARLSLILAGVTLMVGAIVGSTLGIAAGYFGGVVDAVIMRLVETASSIPLILLALAIVTAFGPSFTNVVLVSVFLVWARLARIIRGEVLSLRQREFVMAALLLGASPWRIMGHHIFPNVTNTIVVLLTLQVGQIIVLESSLSFLGLGIPKPAPSWGVMVADGRGLISVAWWVALIPGLFIALVVLSMNMFGDWLRDRIDPVRRRT